MNGDEEANIEQLSLTLIASTLHSIDATLKVIADRLEHLEVRTTTFYPTSIRRPPEQRSSND